MNTEFGHILYVEDDGEIASLLQEQMSQYNFRLSIASNGTEMETVLKNSTIDLVLLDIGLPGEDGLSICRRLRQASNIPVIMLTAQADQIEKIIGLEMGADDYVVKPFSTRELIARIRAVLRRSHQRHEPVLSQEKQGIWQFLGWNLNTTMRQLHDPEGARVTLTTAEFDLLSIFCRHAGQIVTRDRILGLMPHRAASLENRSIDVLVSRLRQKIEPDVKDPQIIKTVRLGGYLFTPQVQDASCPS